jgi:hypothetical protein
MQIKVVRDNPGVKGDVTRVQGSATANGLTGDELTMGVTLRNDGNLISQTTRKNDKDDPFGSNGPAPNVAYLQYGANAGATITLDLTITVQTKDFLGVNHETSFPKNDVSIDIRCFEKPKVR